MKSKDFKKLALSQLKGKWGAVIVALLIPTLVIVAVSMITTTPTTVYNIVYGGTSYRGTYFINSVLFSALSFVGSIAQFVVSAVIGYGMCRYILKFVRKGSADIGEPFSGFTSGGEIFGRALMLLLLESVFTFLWMLLFFIPGIIASYRYKMAFYILADNDNMTASEALEASKEMMRGHKWGLFKLHLSFIGWIILASLTFGIGYIFLVPYILTAEANFYEYLRGIRDNQQQQFAAYNTQI